MRGRRLTVFIVLIVLGLGAAVFWTVTRPRTISISGSSVVPASFANAAVYDNEALIFSNGRAIVQYDYTSGTAQPLVTDTVFNGFAGIDNLSVSSNKQYLLLHSNYEVDGSLLASALRQQNLDSTNDYWWIYDIKASTFHPLVITNLLKAKWSGNQVLALAGNSSQESLTVFDATGTQVSSTSIPLSSDFFGLSTGYLLQTANGILTTQNGSVSKVVFNSGEAFAVTDDKNYAFATSGQGTSRNLLLLNLQKNSQKVIASHILNQPTFVNGVVLYQTNTDSSAPGAFSTYDLTSHKTTRWNLPTNFNSHLSLLLALNDTTGLMVDTTNNYIVVGSKVHDIAMPNANYTQNLTVGSESISLSSTGDGVVTVNLGLQATPITPEELTTVYDQLVNDGYNLDLINLQTAVAS